MPMAGRSSWPFRCARCASVPRRMRSSWGLNFVRRIRRLNEDSYWAPLQRQFRVHKMSRAGTLTDLHRLAPGPQPQCEAISQGRQPGRHHPQQLGDAGGNLEAGFDLKYGITSRLTADITALDRLLTGRSRRGAGQPDALFAVLPGEARLLPGERWHVHVRRCDRAQLPHGLRPDRFQAVLLEKHWTGAGSPPDPDPGRCTHVRPRGRHRDRTAGHADARTRPARQPRTWLCCGCARTSDQLPTLGVLFINRQASKRLCGDLQPRNRCRCQSAHPALPHRQRLRCRHC